MFSGLPPKADRRLRWYIAHRRIGGPWLGSNEWSNGPSTGVNAMKRSGNAV
jgi:hypothetical protein